MVYGSNSQPVTQSRKAPLKGSFFRRLETTIVTTQKGQQVLESALSRGRGVQTNHTPRAGGVSASPAKAQPQLYVANITNRTGRIGAQDRSG